MNNEKWIQYCDPSQYVGSTSMPVLFVNGGTELYKITSLEMSKNSIRARVDSQTKINQDELHCMFDVLPGDDKSRTWHTLPANVERFEIISELLPADAQKWFLTVTDDRGLFVSSEDVFK